MSDQTNPEIAALVDAFADVRADVNRLIEIVDNQVTLLQKIKDEVQPALNALMGNPMFKMMFGGGGQ